jgi:hypothetical protein
MQKDSGTIVRETGTQELFPEAFVAALAEVSPDPALEQESPALRMG